MSASLNATGLAPHKGEPVERENPQLGVELQIHLGNLEGDLGEGCAFDHRRI